MALPAPWAPYGQLELGMDAQDALINVQNINSLNELKAMDATVISDLCKAVRRPVGVIPNPNANAVGAPATILNPGVVISQLAEKNLRLAIEFLCK